MKKYKQFIVESFDVGKATKKVASILRNSPAYESSKGKLAARHFMSGDITSGVEALRSMTRDERNQLPDEVYEFMREYETFILQVRKLLKV